MSSQNELYSLLIPLRHERLLVPRMCVAEVIAFADTDRSDDEKAPDWLLGNIEWNGRRLPVVSFDAVAADDEHAPNKKASRSRIVVFHAIGERLKTRFYGVLTQGFPQLVRVNPDVVSLDIGAELPENQPLLCRVQMIHEFPLIPDLELLEDRLADVESAA